MMRNFTYTLPGFKGYSAIENRQATQAEDMQNFKVRERSLKTRGGCLDLGPRPAEIVKSILPFKTKAGDKYFFVAEGTNLWKTNSDMSVWDDPALKTDCDNAIFDSAVFLDKIFMGNGVDKLQHDGTTLSAIGGTPPNFTIIESYKNRLWCNDTSEPTFLKYGDTGSIDTLGDHYIQIAENTGDGIKGFIPLLTHLFILNEFSAYALYGSSADDFTKTAVGPVGAVNNRSIVNLNETIYWLSQDGVYSYSGAAIIPISFNLGELSDIVNTSKLSDAVAVGYDNYYWLAIAGVGQTTNDTILLYDTITGDWDIFKFPFSIYDFCLDGAALYCAASDKKIYVLDAGTNDDGTNITARWVSDALDMNKPGREKKIKNIAVELADITGGGTLNLYLKEDNKDFSSAYSYTIPTAAPGITIVKKVNTGKFYNLTVKLETTAQATINNITFGGKVKGKVK